MKMINRGHKLAIVIIVTFTIISLYSIINTFFQSNSESEAFYSTLAGFVRLAIECIIFMFFYRGYLWARVVLVIEMCIYAMIALYALIFAHTFYLQILLYFILYTGTLALLFSKPIKSYQTYKKTGRIENSNLPE